MLDIRVCSPDEYDHDIMPRVANDPGRWEDAEGGQDAETGKAKGRYTETVGRRWLRRSAIVLNLLNVCFVLWSFAQILESSSYRIVSGWTLLYIGLIAAPGSAVVALWGGRDG